MFSFFDEPTPMDIYFDNMSYFEKRNLIADALRNNPISSPYTKAEIIGYAQFEASQGIFNASYSALNGVDNEEYFIGKPDINPVTNEPNPIEETKGVIGHAGDKLKVYGVGAGAVAIAGVFAYVYLIGKVKK